MPSYLWKCDKCERSFEILRHWSEYEQQPSEEDMKPWDPEELEEYRKCEHTWKRLITQVQPFRRGPGWNYRKPV